MIQRWNISEGTNGQRPIMSHYIHCCNLHSVFFLAFKIILIYLWYIKWVLIDQYLNLLDKIKAIDCDVCDSAARVGTLVLPGVWSGISWSEQLKDFLSKVNSWDICTDRVLYSEQKQIAVRTNNINQDEISETQGISLLG